MIHITPGTHAGTGAGGDDQHVRAQLVDLAGDALLGTLAQPDGEHHRGDPDQDPEHREGTAQFARSDRSDRDPDCLEQTHPTIT